MKTLVFDMDGTIADLYGVVDWLPRLQAEDVTPYENAQPLYDMDSLVSILNELKEIGYRIIVTSWTSKNASKHYRKEIKQAKIEWLNRYNFPYDEIHVVKYGTTKADCTRKYGNEQTLIDDDKNVRKGWTLGNVIDALNENIIEKLAEMLLTE